MGEDLRDALDADTSAFLERIGGRLVPLGNGPGLARDVDGVLGGWLSEHDAHSVVIRPDAYVFGAAASANDLRSVVSELRQRLDEA